MYCPHCGAENDDGNRYCVSCGSALSQGSAAEATPVSLRERAGRLVGTTPRARLITTITVAALLVAIVAFIALEPSEETTAPYDSYLQQTDSSCVAEKERITTLERETLQARPSIEEFASVLVTIVAEWRSDLQQTPAPPVHAEGVQALESALLGVLVEAGALARVAREERPSSAIAAQASRVDTATAEANRAIEELGLVDCADVAVGLASATGS